MTSSFLNRKHTTKKQRNYLQQTQVINQRITQNHDI